MHHFILSFNVETFSLMLLDERDQLTEKARDDAVQWRRARTNKTSLVTSLVSGDVNGDVTGDVTGYDTASRRVACTCKLYFTTCEYKS